MHKYLKSIFIILFSINLSACDGIDLDSVDTFTDEEAEFTASELAFNVIYSDLLLSDSGFGETKDGFIALFDTTSSLDVIELRNNDNDDDALVGSYEWTIDDEELLVTYPDGVTCTSTKTTDSTTQYNATSDCDGGSPDNDEIEGSINTPNALEEDDLEGDSITIENEDDDDDAQRIEFFSFGTFEITDLDSDGDNISGTTETGTYETSSVFNNVVRMDNTSTGGYSLLVLLDGSLSLGTLLELRYTDNVTNTLEQVRIYNIDSANEWDIDSLYDDISIDN